MKIPKDAKDIALAVLAHPELHYKSCYKDIAGRPDALNCICPLRETIEKIERADI